MNMEKMNQESDALKAPFYKKRWFLIAAAVVAALLVIYLGFAIYFQSHFCFGTTINGVKAGGKNAAKVEKMISNEVDGYTLTLKERDDKTETIEGEAVSLAPDFGGEVEKLLKKQNGFAWIAKVFQKPVYTLETMLTYDEDALTDVVEKLSCMQKENQTEPENAYVDDYNAKDGFAVVAAKQGTVIEKEKLMDAVEDAIVNLASELDLDEADCYEKPSLDENDKDFKKLVETLNDYAGVTITYDVGDKSEVLDGSTISKWLSISDDMKVSVDEDAVAAYVSDIASKYNTCYSAETLATSYGQTVTISKSTYGWKIDNDGEAAQILEDLKGKKAVEREPVYKQKANSHGANDYGDSYVEINLTAQHLFLYKNGQLIMDTDFVSGSLAGGNASPTGAYGISYTERNATLKGRNANGSSYATPVSYWMPFAGNVGMHDATWRSDFGGTIYKRSGSHGCINLPVSAAKTIFENVAAGYPVLVYELPGTESEKGLAMDAAYEVTKTIDAIGEVTLDSGNAISAARQQYDALTDQGKGYVKNYDVLTAAETSYSQQQAAQQAAANQAAADAAAAQQAAADAAKAQSEAQTAINAISAIGTVTADDACKARIDAARSAYNSLSASAQGYVTNLSTLTDAEAQYNNLINSANS